jgi:hypothetical protein
MRAFNRSIAAGCLTLGLTIGGAVSVAAAGNNDHRHYYGNRDSYDKLRDLVDRTQNDLRVAADLEHKKGDQRERYQDAQGHLSTFDRNLTKGKFDKGELDKSIDKIKQILDKNVLQASSRDALMRDLEDLRVARARRD